MGKTRKNAKIIGKNKKTRDLEDGSLNLNISELDSASDSDSDSGSDSGSDSDSDSDSGSDTSISKELNTMLNDGIDSIKDGSAIVPVISIGLIAIIGFALYKGAKV